MREAVGLSLVPLFVRSMRRIRQLLVAPAPTFVLALLVIPTAAAQSTNLSLYQELAVECIGDLPAGVDSVAVESPDMMPYVRSALVDRWQTDGRAVFLTDSPLDAPRLVYDIEEAAVTYGRGRRQFDREVRLALRYTLTNGAGRVLLDDRCDETRADVIDRGVLARIQHDAHPETVGELPQAGWFRRVLEPAVVTAATAVAVYLFFNLRSRRADDS